jgi:PknH-like extracellular domain
MRFVTTAIAITAACVLAAGCGGSREQTAESTPTTPMITSFDPAPVLKRALPGLLLTPEQIDGALAVGDMAVTSTQSEMSDDSATMQPRECLAVDGAAQAPVYADSGFTDVHDVTLKNGDNFTHYAHQAVVLFPDAAKAKSFFDASAQQWTQCHHYSHVQSGTQWDVGPVSNKAGMLSVITTQLQAKAGGWACGRALTANINVIVDVNTCSANPADSAVTIANQIASRADGPTPQR